jgi:hypothetical protein
VSTDDVDDGVFVCIPQYRQLTLHLNTDFIPQVQKGAVIPTLKPVSHATQRPNRPTDERLGNDVGELAEQNLSSVHLPGSAVSIVGP